MYKKLYRPQTFEHLCIFFLSFKTTDNILSCLFVIKFNKLFNSVNTTSDCTFSLPELYLELYIYILVEPQRVLQVLARPKPQKIWLKL